MGVSTTPTVIYTSPQIYFLDRTLTTVLSSSPSSNVAVWGVIVGVVITMTASALRLAITVSIAVKLSKSTVQSLE